MKYALISGACSGLAQAVIKSLEHDFIIFACDINPEILEIYKGHRNIQSFLCDVTDISQINSIKDKISLTSNKLDLIINFAGIVFLGSVIEMAPEIIEKTLQINLIGTYKINYVFFPLIKEGKGRIIIMSSEYGRLLGLPFHSFYTLSKHALEIYDDSLRREVQCFGVKIITIRPGSFNTKMVSNINNQFNELVVATKSFKKPLNKMKAMMLGEIRKAKDPNKIVKTFNKVINSKKTSTYLLR